VLLRNEGVLPLPGTGSVAVLGAFARQPRSQGTGSSGVTPHRVDNLWDSLVERTDPDRLRYAPGYPRAGGGGDEDLLAEARTVAAGSDVAVVVVGLPEAYETEGCDRTHLDLPPGHEALVAAVAEVNPRTVVVLANGAPVLMPWADRVGAIVEAYLGGQAGGSALADVLLGHSEPGGRLAETFPIALADNPVHTWPNGPATVEYRESVFVGYRYYDWAGAGVAFPFGHGLSYTTFAWSPVAFVSYGDSVTVSTTVTNTGNRAGSEVVQVYVHDVESTVYRPVQELKAFAKVWLEPGESRQVTLTLDRQAFAVWDGGWVVEAGTFEIRVGASSRDIRSSVPVNLPGDRHELRPSSYDPEDFEQRYGRPLPPNELDRRGTYTLNTPLGDIRHPVARLLLAVLRRGARSAFRSTPDNPMVLAIDRLLAEATPRMLPMISLARIRPRAARALVEIANGRPWRAVRRRP
jgi:beta-glucosidase